jgi:hypothetical protein
MLESASLQREALSLPQRGIEGSRDQGIKASSHPGIEAEHREPAIAMPKSTGSSRTSGIQRIGPAE